MKFHKQRRNLLIGAVATGVFTCLPLVRLSCRGEWCMFAGERAKSGLKTLGVPGLALLAVAVVLPLVVGRRGEKMAAWSFGVASAALAGLALLLLTKLGSSGSSTVMMRSLTGLGYVYPLVSLGGPGWAFTARHAPDLPPDPVKEPVKVKGERTADDAQNASSRFAMSRFPTVGEFFLMFALAGVKVSEFNEKDQRDKIMYGFPFFVLCVVGAVLLKRRARRRSEGASHRLHIVRDVQMATACFALGPVLGMSLKMMEHQSEMAIVAVMSVGVLLLIAFMYWMCIVRERNLVLGVGGILVGAYFIYAGVAIVVSKEFTSVLSSISSMIGSAATQRFEIEIRYLGGLGMLCVGSASGALGASLVVSNGNQRDRCYRVLYGSVAGSAFVSIVGALLHALPPENMPLKDDVEQWMGRVVGNDGIAIVIVLLTCVTLLVKAMKAVQAPVAEPQ